MVERREFLIACAGTVLSSAALAADYPLREIRLVIDGPPGSGIDTFSRITAEALSKQLGQPAIIDNRPGAGGQLAGQFVAQAKNDGYTVLFGTNSSQILMPLTKRQLPYDPQRDFAPVSLISVGGLVFVVPANSPFNTLRDYLAEARARQASLSYGSFGPGSMAHILGERLSSQSNAKLKHIPYKGETPVFQDLLSGVLDAGFLGQTNAKVQVEARKVKALAATGAQRYTSLPDVPTFEEQGFNGFDMAAWIGAYVPASTSPQVIATLSKAFAAALSQPEVRRRFSELGFNGVGSTPETLAKQNAEERRRWAKMAEDAGVPRE